MAEEETSSDSSLLATLSDELRLQAWLGNAELRNPSEHQEVNTLAQWRDELRVQMHLGKLEAREEFEKLESVWSDVKLRVERAAEDAEEGLHDLLRTIRDGYDRMRGQ